jgi:hypothetical protein
MGISVGHNGQKDPTTGNIEKSNTIVSNTANCNTVINTSEPIHMPTPSLDTTGHDRSIQLDTTPSDTTYKSPTQNDNIVLNNTPSINTERTATRFSNTDSYNTDISNTEDSLTPNYISTTSNTDLSDTAYSITAFDNTHSAIPDFSNTVLGSTVSRTTSNSIIDSAITLDDNTHSGITLPGSTDLSNAQYHVTHARVTSSSITANGMAHDAITDINTAQSYTAQNKPRGNALFLSVIRDYLNRALGDADRVEIKIKDMEEDLGISKNALYRHLRTLRDTEFFITKLRFSTELKRRIPKK